ncbi:MAG: outer membrane beta-barrel protein [Planctomycetota bacterium]|jgi:hypothetical protein
MDDRAGRWLAGAAVAILLLATVGSSPVRAEDDDYGDEDFGLRLASSFIRFRDVLTGGGLTAANRWPSPINPASLGWSCPPGPRGVTAGAYYSPIFFDEGTRLDVAGAAVVWRTPKWGTILPAVSLIESNEATTRQGPTFDYVVESADLAWAKRWSRVGVGASFNYAHAEVRQDLGPLRVVDSDANSYRFRVGGLYEPACNWVAGLAVEYGWAPFTTDNVVLGPAGPVPARLEGTDRQVVVRPGVSYAYGPYSSAYADYQYGRFWSDRGRLEVHRFSLGADHQLLAPLFLRPVVTVDGRGNWEWAFGVGVQFARWGGLDFAYKYNAFPELIPEFGKSHTFQVTLSIRL